jgi:ribonuclease-3
VEVGAPAPATVVEGGGAGAAVQPPSAGEPAPPRRHRSRSRRPSGAAKAAATTPPDAATEPAGPLAEMPAPIAVAATRELPVVPPEPPPRPAQADAPPTTFAQPAEPPARPPEPSLSAPQLAQPSGPLPELTSRVALSADEQKGLDDLAARLQINFRRSSLLREAMTHASWNNERGEPSGPGYDNERLEYLGDAVLELVVGEYLFRRFPGYDEGQLTQLRAALVNTMSLAKLAERLGLGDALLLGKGAAKTGARLLPSLQANCFEAMIGAIFLDQGYRVATRVFLQSIGDLSEWSDENHKGRLQEAAQVRLGATPSYRVTAIGGPGHRREYRAEAVVAGKVLAEGRGSTKQAAEQAAARVAVEGLTTPAAGRPGAPARARRPAPPAEPARVRRRVAEVAADRRAASRPPAAPVAVAPTEPPRARGLLGALRAAAQGLVKRHPEPVAPPPAASPEPSATPAQRRNHRGHRGGRGRHRPSSAPGSQPSSPAELGTAPSGSSPAQLGAPSAASSPSGSRASGSSSSPSPSPPSRSAPRSSRRRPSHAGSPASGPPPAAPPPP